MASPAKRIPKNTSKKAAPVAKLSRQELDEQVKAFLKSGGKIEQVPKGQSGAGDQSPGRKHIVIAKK